MEKIIQTLINSWTKGVDTYTHNGSTWLIFTESKQWVIELTDSKTLWYNYNFFKQIFEFTSLDVVDNQQYITKWVEDNIINGSKNTPSPSQTPSYNLVEVIENGVKETITSENRSRLTAENIIENGVKETSHNATMFQSMKVEDTIQNGVNHTSSYPFNKTRLIEDAIQNGVKKTKGAHMKTDWSVEDTLENGVKETNATLRRTLLGVDDIIQNGIKETRLEMNITEGEVDDIIQDGVKLTQFNDNENKSWVEGVIENGVKETMFNQGHKQLTVKNIIKNGVRHTLNTEYMSTSMVEDIIQSGVKHTEYGDWLDGDERLDDIIENGVKETKQKKNAFLVLDTSGRELILESHLVIRDGVKETKTPGKDGDIMSTVEWMNENNSNSYPKMIDDVIENGEKINGTYAGGQRQSIKCKSVVEYGTKTKTPGCPGV